MPLKIPIGHFDDDVASHILRYATTPESIELLSDYAILMTVIDLLHTRQNDNIRSRLS